MSQERQHSTANQLLTLPDLSNGNDLKARGDAKRVSRSWWRRRKVMIGIVIILLILLVSGGVILSQLGSNSSRTYRHQRAIQGDLSLTIEATGPVQSPTYNLAANTTSRIDEINVKVGQVVKRGQVLARLDRTGLQDAVDQAQATVNADQDALYNVEVDAHWITTPAVTQAVDTLKIAQAQLDAAKHNLNNATLKAPHAGVVTAINGTVGGTPGIPANAGSGASGGTFFIQIVDLSSLQIQANVNESDIANLQVGDPVAFTVNAYSGRQFKGTVSAISFNGVLNSDVVTYPVYIDVDMQSVKGAHVLPNMTADATISVVQLHNVLLIPVNAINFAQMASSGNAAGGTIQLVSQQEATAAVNQARQMLNDLESHNADIAAHSPILAFVIEDSRDGTFMAKPVVLGLTDGNFYEVLEGLSAGESFIGAVEDASGSGANSNSTPNGGSSGGLKKGG